MRATIDHQPSSWTQLLVNGQFGRPARGMGFGLGVQVVEDPVAADLRQSKVTIIMMQTSTPALQRDFEHAVMQAIVE